MDGYFRFWIKNLNSLEIRELWNEQRWCWLNAYATLYGWCTYIYTIEITINVPFKLKYKRLQFTSLDTRTVHRILHLKWNFVSIRTSTSIQLLFFEHLNFIFNITIKFPIEEGIFSSVLYTFSILKHGCVR